MDVPVQQKPELTPILWKAIVAALKEEAELPLWLHEFLALSYDEITSVLAERKRLAIRIELHEMIRSYVKFLEVQIELGARDPEWGKLLEKRRQAYDPRVGKEILKVSLYGKANHAYLDFDAQPLKPILIEFHEGSIPLE
jgi:hypothetical protein